MIKTKRIRARDRARGLADNKLDKLAYSINDLQELGFGCRAYVYSEINAGRLRATKRGRYTIILARDLDAWTTSLPTIRPRSALAAE